MVDSKYVLGMNGTFYEICTDFLNGLLLIHVRERTRLFVQGYQIINGVLYWKNGTEYPEKVCFYQAGSAVLTDIELDLCPQWREKATAIDKKKYLNLKEGKVKTTIYG